MTEIPKLTADEAAVLRYAQTYYEGGVGVAVAKSRSALCIDDLFVTDLGRAALAAFDAAERAKIRVEAMRECEAIAAEFAKRSGRVDDPREFFEDLILDIRALIAKETP